MVYAFNPNTQEVEAEELYEFEASLFYIASSRPDKAITKKKKKKKHKKKKKTK